MRLTTKLLKGQRRAKLLIKLKLKKKREIIEKCIKDFEDYAITDDGKVISYKYKEPHILKTYLQKKGMKILNYLKIIIHIINLFIVWLLKPFCQIQITFLMLIIKIKYEMTVVLKI